MIDQKTPYLQLPLPHQENYQEDDLPRLRQAFYTIDSKIAALDVLLSSDDTTLDSIQELVLAIKHSAGDIASIFSGKADKTYLAQQMTTIDQRLISLDQSVGSKLTEIQQNTNSAIAANKRFAYFMGGQ